MEFLFAPRRWVAALARCEMKRLALRPNQYIVVHVRHSAEKKHERGRSLPRLSDFGGAAEAALRKAKP